MKFVLLNICGKIAQEGIGECNWGTIFIFVGLELPLFVQQVKLTANRFKVDITSRGSFSDHNIGIDRSAEANCVID